MRTFVKGIGALVLLSALTFGAVELISLAMRQIGHQLFHGVNHTVAAAVVAATATTTVAIVTLVLGRHFERGKAIEAEMRASKIPIYSKLVTGLLTMLRTTGTEQQKVIDSLFNELTPELINWASDDVLVAWSRFKRGAANQSGIEIVFAFEKVRLAIRRDYGHKGKRISEGDLLGLFINDIDDQLPSRKRTPSAIVVAPDPIQPE